MIQGVIFDYGGTLDSRGVHWSEVLWQGYQQAQVPIDKATFRTAYVEGERALARERIILPQNDFHTLLLKKVAIEISYLPEQPDTDTRDRWVEEIAAYCDNAARSCINEAMPVLEQLHERYPMMLVSNFYGNIDEVLRAYGIRHLFKGIIESAVVGVRKPNPTLFRLGVDALELPAEEVLVVGDSLRKDIEPAEQLGCPALWLKGKGWTDEEDQQTHPHTITRITEVPEWIERL
ncbi:MAG: HAD family hydrolase [Muribaculaceae bacterium]|nr:HAD family hydrolase [Muribaculaceae bacterium]MBQ7205372.1 HAD family hydrolase [Muribaculaceae bacterium]